MKWHEEYTQLRPVFENQPSVDQAKAHLAKLEDHFDGLVKEAEKKIAQAEKALKGEELERLEKTHIAGKIEDLREELRLVKDQQRMRVAQAKGVLDCRVVWEPQRKHYEALRAKARRLEALQV